MTEAEHRAGRRAGTGPGPARARFGLDSPGARVWAYTGLVSLLALLAYLVGIRGLADSSASSIPWLLLAAGITLAELKTVTVQFRRERHAYSLSEIPLVIGLFTLSPGDYVLAAAVGTATALMLEPRQNRMRRVFNFGNGMLVALLTLGLFLALERLFSRSGLAVTAGPDWVIALASTAASSVAGTLSVATVVTLSGGARSLRISEMLQFGIMVAVANTSLALVAVIVIETQPLAMALLSVPVVTVYFAYRAYLSEHEKHERLEMLYESSRILQDSPELDAAVVSVLEHTRRMFLAEIGQIVLLPDRPTGEALVTTSVERGTDEVMVQVRYDREPELWRRARADRRPFLWSPEVPETIAGRTLRQAMACPLAGEAGGLGVLLVANKRAEGSVFEPEDLRLLETVANQVGTALENGQLERSLGELSRLKEQLRHQAYHDALTGLPNRSLFAEQVARRVATRAPGEQPVVMFLDLDDFKVVNDTMGHAAGDRLLVSVAERISECVRSADVAARLGGDEFAILLGRGAVLADAMAVGERLVSALRLPFHVEGQEVIVGASVGIAVARPDLAGVDELLRDADVAMYTAKAGGKRRLAVFDPLLHGELLARHRLSAELSRSLGRGELLVHYQPIVDLGSQRLVGVEALVRWSHPVRGIIPPDEFIHLAEENGSIDALGAFVLGEACRQAAGWRRDHPAAADLWVSVNISPLQLRGSNLRADVAEALRAAGLDPAALVLEMTESGMFEETAATTSTLAALREDGVRIALDDFGTGYSSLGFLRRFPIDILKIARDFVSIDARPGGPDERGWAFAEAIVAMATRLGLATIAEGIEDRQQLARLVEMGCGWGQGFHFSRPIPPEGIAALLGARVRDARAPSAEVRPAPVSRRPSRPDSAAEPAAGAARA